MPIMPTNWKNVAGFVLCAIWLAFTTAFVAMVTSGGEANMELEIGPFLKLQDTAAIFFSRASIGIGILMVILFLLKFRVGFALALIWSAWWGVILSTALLSSPGLSDRVIISIVVLLFITSAWFALTRLRAERPADGN